MMLSAKLGCELTVRDSICQDFVTRTKMIVLANATLAAPLKLWMSISKYPFRRFVGQGIGRLALSL
jgi:hypothetical protein